MLAALLSLAALAGCAAALACAALRLWPMVRVLRLARGFPGPPAWPLIGNLLDLHGDARHTFEFAVRMGRTYGAAAFRIWVGPKLMVVLSDPRDIQTVLGDGKIVNHDRSMTDAMTMLVANGMFTARDKEWKVHRKLLAPSFSLRQLQSYVPTFGANADILCRKLEALPDGSTLDVRRHLGLCTMDAICETAIGVHMNIQGGENLGFVESINDSMRLIHNRVVKPWLLIGWLYPWTRDGKEAVRTKQKICEFTERVVATKMAATQTRLRGARSDDAQPGDDGRKEVRSLLDLLLDAAAKGGEALLSAGDIRDELTTTAAAGFETTALTISNLLLLLGLHPLVQDEISRELDEIFHGDLRPASMDDLGRMTCLNAALKETLRLIPVVPTLSREIPEDVRLTSGQVVPAGSTCLVFTYSVHRDPRLFPEPERFLPGRWQRGPAAPANRPYAYLPFGGGHRNCIGHKYAALQMKSIASSLLRRFRVSHRLAEEDLRDQRVGVSMSMSKPYEVTFTRRRD